MSKAEKQIRERVEAFVGEISTLVREAALETVQQALAGAGMPSTPRPHPGRPRKAQAATKRPTAKKRATGKRGRRSSGDVDATAGKVLAYVKANDGCAVGDIGKELGMTTPQLRLPLQKLLGDKQLKTTGQKRGTRYHAGSGRAASKKKVTRKKATGRKKKAARKKAARKKAARKKAARKKAARKKAARKKATRNPKAA